MPSALNFSIGPAVVKVGPYETAGGAGTATDRGYTKNPATVQVTLNDYEIKTEQAYGTLRKVPIDGQVKVKATLSEATLTNIKDILRQPTGNLTGTEPNATLLVGAFGEIYHQVVFVGKGARATATGADATRTWTFHRCIVESIGEFSVGKGGEMVAEVTWDVLYDETISAANKFWSVSDSGAT